MRISELTLTAAADAISKGDLKPRELVEESLSMVRRLNPTINAVITLTEEEAKRDAGLAEQRVGTGRGTYPLNGIPVLVKDTVFTKGIRTTAGSLILKDFIPDYDATVVSRLKTAGAVVVGKAHTHELALAGTSINPHFGACRNPWDTERIPGGSSGGSAAAVAASLVLLATGSDSAGSIRIPASFCGVVGLKPTYGSVSRYGVLPHSWSLCHVGPITKTIEDAALAFNSMVGYDSKDPTSVKREKVSIRPIRRGVRIGIPEDLMRGSCQPEVEKVFWELAGRLEGEGFQVDRLTLPLMTSHAASVRLIIERCEVSSYHEEHYERNKDLYGEDVRLIIEVGTKFSALDYIRALRLRRLVIREFLSTMKQRRLDALLMPTVPTLPFKIADILGDAYGYSMKYGPAITLYTAPFSLVGCPALSVNAGFAGHLPVGVQIIGKFYDEGTILGIGKVVEDMAPKRVPPIV